MPDISTISISSRAARILLRACAALLMLIAGSELRAQSNFAFWLGGTGLYHGVEQLSWGTSVGMTAKFNVTPIFLLRSQFNVDRIQYQDAGLPDYDGAQTMTFVCLGTGPEIEFGGRDFNVLAHVTIFGDIRTVSRILQEDGKEKVWMLTRCSMGVLSGFGVEAYITDNIGVELQGQYTIFNLDGTTLDPTWRGVRVAAGVQFLLGRNFVR